MSPRQILRRQLERAAERGLRVCSATELEFFLFTDSYEEARRQGLAGPDAAHLDDRGLPAAADVARGVHPAAHPQRDVAAGIPVEFSKGEAGRGQHEVNVTYDEALVDGRPSSGLQERDQGDRGAGGPGGHVHGQVDDGRRGLVVPRAHEPVGHAPGIAYEKFVWETKNLFGHSFIISDPVGVKRVLVDNVANYPKTESETKMLGAVVGEGLLVSQGEKWKSHRRLMSPSFDFKSIISYSPAMVATAEKFANEWAKKRNDDVVDIAEEMTNLTLEIISNTMFSADGGLLGELVDRSLRKMGDAIDFNILDIMPLVGPPRMKRKLARIHQNFMAMDSTMQKLIHSRE